MDTNNNLNVTNTYDPSLGYCMNRLPCGYCRVLEKPCPMIQGTINPYLYGGPTVTYTTNTTDKLTKSDNSPLYFKEDEK